MSTRSKDELAFEPLNYKLLLIGIAIIILGFILMSGGGSGDPNVFNADELFSHRRITVAPIVCVIGYVFVIYAIMHKAGANGKGKEVQGRA